MLINILLEEEKMWVKKKILGYFLLSRAGASSIYQTEASSSFFNLGLTCGAVDPLWSRGLLFFFNLQPVWSTGFTSAVKTEHAALFLFPCDGPYEAVLPSELHRRLLPVNPTFSCVSSLCSDLQSSSSPVLATNQTFRYMRLFCSVKERYNACVSFGWKIP